MKRSRSLSLILMGSLALGSSGCGSDNADEQMYTFRSKQECVNSGLFSDSDCDAFVKDAIAQTPRFSSKEDCETQFGVGACDGGSTQASAAKQSTNGTTVSGSSGSSWMPMMMGFMAGRYLSGGGMMQGSQGLYRDPASAKGGNNFRTAGGDSVVSDSKGKVTNNSSRLTQSMNHNAKPVQGRAGNSGRSGFTGGGSSSRVGGS